MRQIEVDDEVFDALEKRAIGFNCTPNFVLRRILELDPQEREAGKTKVQMKADPLVEFLESQEFRIQRKAEQKYLAILRFLYETHKENFSSIESYGRGSRTYFSQDQKNIQESAPYATVKRIEGSPYYAMTTIDNSTKRKVLDFALRLFGYSNITISRALQTIPSSTHAGG